MEVQEFHHRNNQKNSYPSTQNKPEFTCCPVYLSPSSDSLLVYVVLFDVAGGCCSQPPPTALRAEQFRSRARPEQGSGCGWAKKRSLTQCTLGKALQPRTAVSWGTAPALGELHTRLALLLCDTGVAEHKCPPLTASLNRLGGKRPFPHPAQPLT